MGVSLSEPVIVGISSCDEDSMHITGL